MADFTAWLYTHPEYVMMGVWLVCSLLLALFLGAATTYGKNKKTTVTRGKKDEKSGSFR
jgi:septal ring-binding cell division protein DamX